MKNFYLFIIFASFITSIFGQTEQLTLNIAIEKALEHNPQLNQLKAQQKAKQHEWRKSTGIHNPEFTYAKEGIKKTGQPQFEEQRVEISQSIDFPVTTTYRLKRINREKEAFNLQIKAYERNLKAIIKQQYIELLYTIYYKELTEEQLNIAQTLEQAVTTRAKTGLGTGMDRLKAEIQLAKAQNDKDFAERIHHQARYELFNAMGLDEDDQKYSLQFTDTLRTKNDVINQSAALEYVDKHPSYLAILKKIDASIYKIKEAKSNMLPDINFGLYRQDYGTGFNYTGFEVGIRVPLWAPLNYKGEIETAKANQEELKWVQKETLLDMKMQIEHAWHNYESSKQSVERFRKIISSKSKKLQEMTLEAYKLGEIDLMNLLNAQQIYLDTRKNYLIALKDYYIQLTKLEKYMNSDIVY